MVFLHVYWEHVDMWSVYMGICGCMVCNWGICVCMMGIMGNILMYDGYFWVYVDV